MKGPCDVHVMQWPQRPAMCMSCSGLRGSSRCACHAVASEAPLGVLVRTTHNRMHSCMHIFHAGHQHGQRLLWVSPINILNDCCLCSTKWVQNRRGVWSSQCASFLWLPNHVLHRCASHHVDLYRCNQNAWRPSWTKHMAPLIDEAHGIFSQHVHVSCRMQLNITAHEQALTSPLIVTNHL